MPISNAVSAAALQIVGGLAISAGLLSRSQTLYVQRFLSQSLFEKGRGAYKNAPGIAATAALVLSPYGWLVLPIITLPLIVRFGDYIAKHQTYAMALVMSLWFVVRVLETIVVFIIMFLGSPLVASVYRTLEQSITVIIGCAITATTWNRQLFPGDWTSRYVIFMLSGMFIGFGVLVLFWVPPFARNAFTSFLPVYKEARKRRRAGNRSPLPALKKEEYSSHASRLLIREGALMLIGFALCVFLQPIRSRILLLLVSAQIGSAAIVYFALGPRLFARIVLVSVGFTLYVFGTRMG